MMAQEFISKGMQLLQIGAGYYGMQLMRCALVSLGVFVLVWFLRKTFCKNHVFLKGALWSLFLPVLFVGKMKFFYEHMVGVMLFTWLPQTFLNHIWIYGLYFLGVFVSMALLFTRRRKLQKMVANMEKRTVRSSLHPGSPKLFQGCAAVYVTKAPVTPFSIGLFRPKIVVPQVILEEYDEEEIQMILLHEQVHIRRGHLWIYFLWDLMRAFLWVNPLLHFGTKFLREDMEEVCDWVTIQRSGRTSYAYGRLLIKSMRFLQAEKEAFNMYATFMGNEEYQDVRRRMTQIARYKPYKRIALMGMLFAVFLGVAGMVLGIENVSFDRCNENDSMLVYAFDVESNQSRLLAQDDNVDKEAFRTNGLHRMTSYDKSLHKMISYDDSYVYVKREAFEDFLHKKNAFGEIFIVFGGFYKLPGFVGRGYSCCYEAGSEEEVVRISYDRQADDNWMLTLIKMM